MKLHCQVSQEQLLSILQWLVFQLCLNFTFLFTRFFFTNWSLSWMSFHEIVSPLVSAKESRHLWKSSFLNVFLVNLAVFAASQSPLEFLFQKGWKKKYSEKMHFCTLPKSFMISMTATDNNPFLSLTISFMQFCFFKYIYILWRL